MAWIEQSHLRKQRSKTYQDDTDPLKHAWSGTLAVLHYQSELDSGVYDTEINMTPVRIDNPAFDGWRTIVNSWHYALGKDLAHHGDQDGWVGFGGRQGAHWFKFRLLRTGYLHWPTRSWDNIGGAPTYNRANLSQETGSATIGPNDDEVAVTSLATWSSIWATPEGGDLSVSWKIDGDRCPKEEIIVNQAGREWIAANRPPATPLDQTYFGFVFRLDWSDIPRIYRAGLLQNIDEDFADDGEIIELRDALDRLLALMPLSTVTVSPDQALDDLSHIAPLRKRFWRDADGNHYLLIGIRCDTLNSLPAGDLVFDPTFNIAAGGDDGYAIGCNLNTTANQVGMGEGPDSGNSYYSFFLFSNVTVPQGATVNSAKVTLIAKAHDTVTAAVDIYCEDVDDGTVPSDCNDLMNKTRTTATANWEFTAWVGNDSYDSPSLTGPVQEVFNRGGWSSGNHVNVLMDNDAPTSVDRREAYSYDGDSAKAAVLTITYTEAAGDAVLLELGIARGVMRGVGRGV